jgi:4-hydroxybenzoate polyprenyltransferase
LVGLQLIQIFYLGAIFWTLGYDTIYGYQDIKDDEIIGLKSTSIKFKKNPYTFLYLCYSIFIISLLIVGYLMKLNTIYFIFLILVFFQMIIFQLKNLNIEVSSNCLRAFKSNNFLGLIVFLGLVVGKI